jgi:hypothetical protein
MEMTDDTKIAGFGRTLPAENIMHRSAFFGICQLIEID